MRIFSIIRFVYNRNKLNYTLINFISSFGIYFIIPAGSLHYQPRQICRGAACGRNAEIPHHGGGGAVPLKAHRRGRHTV